LRRSRFRVVASHRRERSLRVRHRGFGASSRPFNHLRRRIETECAERKWIDHELEGPSGATPHDRDPALRSDGDLVRRQIVSPRLHQYRACPIERVEIDAGLVGRNLNRPGEWEGIERRQAVREGRECRGSRGHQANDDWPGTTLRGQRNRRVRNVQLSIGELGPSVNGTDPHGRAMQG